MWKEAEEPPAMGPDLGDRHSHLCVLNKQGDAVWKDRVAAIRKRLRMDRPDPKLRSSLHVAWPSAFRRAGPASGSAS